MNLSTHLEQAPWTLLALVGGMTLLVMGVSIGIIAIARFTACTATEAAKALATVLAATRRKAHHKSKVSS